MAVMKSPGHELGACLWDHQANLAVQQAKLDCFVYRLALLWLKVTHKSWQPEQRTKLSLGKGLLAGGGHMTWALLSTSHPGGAGVLELGGGHSFYLPPSLGRGCLGALSVPGGVWRSWQVLQDCDLSHGLTCLN